MEKIFIALVVAVAVIIGVLFTLQGETLLGGEPINSRITATNSTATTTGNASKLILSASSGAQLRCFTNKGTTTVSLGFGTSTGLTANSGYVLGSTTALFVGNELYTGDVYAFSAATGTVIAICEL